MKIQAKYTVMQFLIEEKVCCSYGENFGCWNQRKTNWKTKVQSEEEVILQDEKKNLIFQKKKMLDYQFS